IIAEEVFMLALVGTAHADEVLLGYTIAVPLRVAKARVEHQNAFSRLEQALSCMSPRRTRSDHDEIVAHDAFPMRLRPMRSGSPSVARKPASIALVARTRRQRRRPPLGGRNDSTCSGEASRMAVRTANFRRKG